MNIAIFKFSLALENAHEELFSTLAPKLKGGSELSESLIMYSWNHWEDPIDVGIP